MPTWWSERPTPDWRCAGRAAPLQSGSNNGGGCAIGLDSPTRDNFASRSAEVHRRWRLNLPTHTRTEDPTVDIRLPHQWEQWLSQYGLDETNDRWMVAAVVFVITVALVYLMKSIVVRRVADLAARSSTVWDDAAVDAIQQTRAWFVFVVAAFCASLVLLISDSTRQILQTVVVLALLLQMAFWGHVLIGAVVERYVEKRAKYDPAAVMTISALGLLGKLVLFVVLLLLALDNLGIDVTALIAGLGVGGIAVALAVQNILGDLLASLSIVFDKPFVIGDFIIIGDQMGTVQHIGLKTTRLASLSGEQLVFSNNDLLQSRIRNFKRMAERRVVFSVGVTYDTPRETLKNIPSELRQIVEAQEEVRFDRAHFKDFGDFSLNFEIVYYVLTADYNRYMDIQQSINFTIHQRFESVGASFAYPTQMLYVEKLGES